MHVKTTINLLETIRIKKNNSEAIPGSIPAETWLLVYIATTSGSALFPVQFSSLPRSAVLQCYCCRLQYLKLFCIAYLFLFPILKSILSLL